MGFDSSTSSRSDVEVRASVGAFRGDMQQIREEALRGFGALSEESQRAALASEKYDRALLRAKGSTYAVNRATAAYQKEMRALTATTHSTSNATDREERSLGRLLRGAASGTGIFHRLRGAAVFASSSFIGGYGLTAAIRSSTEAAIQHQVVQGQLAAAVDAAGVSYHRNRAAIEEIIHATENLGFAEADSVRSYTLAIRATKDVEKAQHLQAIAADVARGRNISLVSATQLLVRVEAGQVGSLRRLGIEVKKGITGRQALLEVERQYSGASAAYARSAAGEQDRLRVSIHRTEVEIGTALLPTISRLSGRLASWLGQSRNQERIQQDVNHALRDGEAVVHGIGTAYHTVQPGIRAFNRLVGGSEHTVKLLGAAFVAMKLGLLPSLFTAVRASIRGVGAEATVATGELNAMAGAEARVAAGGVAAGAGAAGGAAAAAGGSTFLSRIAPYVGGLGGAAAGGAFGRGVGSALGGRGLILPGLNKDTRPGVPWKNGHVFTQGGKRFLVQATADGVLTALIPLDLVAQSAAAANVSGRGGELNPRAGVPGSPSYAPPSSVTARTRRPLSLVGRLNLVLHDLALAGQTRTNSDDIVELHKEEGILKQLESRGTLAQRTDYAGQLGGVESQLQGFQDQAATARSEAARKAAAVRAKRVREAATAARKARAARERAERALVAQRRKRLQSLTEVPAQLRIEESQAKARGDSAQKIAAIQEREVKALERQVAQLRKMHASKSLIATAEARIAALETERRRELKKQQTSGFSELEREFLTGIEDLAQSRGNIFSGATGANVTVNQHFPTPPTSDGHREAIYARRAALAAFDG